MVATVQTHATIAADLLSIARDHLHVLISLFSSSQTNATCTYVLHMRNKQHMPCDISHLLNVLPRQQKWSAY